MLQLSMLKLLSIKVAEFVAFRLALNKFKKIQLNYMKTALLKLKQLKF